MKQKTFYILSFISFIVCLINYPIKIDFSQSRWATYVILLLTYIAFSTALVSRFSQKISNRKILLVKLAFLSLPSSLIFYFNRSAPLLYYFIGIFFAFVLYLTGRLIARVSLFKSFKNNALLTFACGYIISIFLISIPLNFIPNFTIAIPTQIITIILSVVVLLEVFLSIRELKKLNIFNYSNNNTNSHIKEPFFSFLGWWLVFIFLSSGLILAWGSDDLNSYLYWPLKAVQENVTAVNVNRPVTFTLLSVPTQSVLTYLLSICSIKDGLLATYIYKGFNAGCYSVIFVTAILSSVLLKKTNTIKLFYYLSFIVFSLPITFEEILYNFTDFPVYLSTMCSLFILLHELSDYINQDNWNSRAKTLENYPQYLVSCLAGLLIAISPKAIAPVLSSSISLIFFRLIIIYSQFKKQNKVNKQPSISKLLTTIFLKVSFYKSILINLFLLFIPIVLIAARNYAMTGNPSFPANNVYWKSKYFMTDPNSVVASGHYISGLPLDFAYISRIFSNNVASVKDFAYADLTFGIFGAFLFNLLILYCIYIYFNYFINKTSKNNALKITPDLMSIGIILIFNFLLTIVIVRSFLGDQYRYILSGYIFGIVILLLISVYIFHKEFRYFANVIKSFIIFQIITSFLFINYAVLTYRGMIFGLTNNNNNHLSWKDYYSVMDEIKNIVQKDTNNSAIVLSVSGNQGLIFLFPITANQLDWYDDLWGKNVIIKGALIHSKIDLKYGSKKANKFLRKNNVDYVLISDDKIFISSEFDSNNLIFVKRFDSQNLTLYKLKI